MPVMEIVYSAHKSKIEKFTILIILEVKIALNNSMIMLPPCLSF